jgi:hypothetical protein
MTDNYNLTTNFEVSKHEIEFDPTKTSFMPLNFSSTRAVNGTLLAVYPTRIVPDKMNMGKVLFSLGYWVWVWVRKKFR